MEVGVRFQFRRLADLLAAQAAVAGGTGHASTTGTLRELLVEKFLRPHLPKTIDIRAGVILDSRGARSRQQDLILVDTRFPTISVGSEREALVIAESVLATVEVKSFLDSKELRSALESSRQTVGLYRSGQLHYKKGTIEVTSNLALPILTYVFAFDGASVESLLAEIATVCEKDGSYVPEATCVLTKGTIMRSSRMPTVKSERRHENSVEPGEVRLPPVDTVDVTIRPLLKDALYAFYGRLRDDVFPLELTHYDLDPYFEDPELQ